MTITKTTQGKVVLTTKRKSLQEQAKKTRKTGAAAGAAGGAQAARPGSGAQINRRVGRGGSLRLSTASGNTSSVLRPKEVKRLTSKSSAASRSSRDLDRRPDVP